MIAHLPTKHKTSLDIPTLLKMLEACGPQSFVASAIVPATIRSWELRHDYPKRLSAIAVAGGFTFSLKGGTDVSPK